MAVSDGPESAWCRCKASLADEPVWSPELAMLRSIIFKILGGGTVITILVMWICLPFYWGSRE